MKEQCRKHAKHVDTHSRRLIDLVHSHQNLVYWERYLGSFLILVIALLGYLYYSDYQKEKRLVAGIQKQIQYPKASLDEGKKTANNNFFAHYPPYPVQSLINGASINYDTVIPIDSLTLIKTTRVSHNMAKFHSDELIIPAGNNDLYSSLQTANYIATWDPLKLHIGLDGYNVGNRIATEGKKQSDRMDSYVELLWEIRNFNDKDHLKYIESGNSIQNRLARYNEIVWEFEYHENRSNEARRQLKLMIENLFDKRKEKQTDKENLAARLTEDIDTSNAKAALENNEKFQKLSGEVQELATRIQVLAKIENDIRIAQSKMRNKWQQVQAQYEYIVFKEAREKPKQAPVWFPIQFFEVKTGK